MRDGAEDPIGLYFDCFEQVTGSKLDLELGAIDARGDVRWTHLRHAAHDGLGAILRATGGAVSVHRGSRPKTSFGASIRGVYAYLRTRREEGSSLSVDYDAAGDDSRAFLVLSGDETRALVARARSEACTLGVLLLVSLHRALTEMAPTSDGLCVWSYPVDMRGLASLPDPTSNHVVALRVRLDDSAAPAAVARAIQGQLARGLHLGAWTLASGLARLGPGVLRRLIRRDEVSMRARGQWFAIFSNLGAMQGSEEVAARVLLGPVCATSPLAATALTWNGRLSLAITVHPGLVAHGIDGPGLLAKWRSVLG